jgi:hypothetical protein
MPVYKTIYEVVSSDLSSPDEFGIKIEANFRLKALTTEEEREIDEMLDKVEDTIFKFRRRKRIK